MTYLAIEDLEVLTPYINRYPFRIVIGDDEAEFIMPGIKNSAQIQQAWPCYVKLLCCASRNQLWNRWNPGRSGRIALQ
jgi:hypothetical protein